MFKFLSRNFWLGFYNIVCCTLTLRLAWDKYWGYSTQLARKFNHGWQWASRPFELHLWTSLQVARTKLHDVPLFRPAVLNLP